MDAAIAALAGAAIGAAIGAAASLGSAWIQQRHQTRRDLLRSAVELGQAERQELIDKLKSQPGGGALLPVSVYVAHHAEVLQAIAAGRYGPEVVRRIEEAQQELVKSLPRRGRAAEEV